MKKKSWFYKPSPQNTVFISEHKSDFFPKTWMEQSVPPISAHLHKLNNKPTKQTLY